jgi:hypothetical protein
MSTSILPKPYTKFQNIINSKCPSKSQVAYTNDSKINQSLTFFSSNSIHQMRMKSSQIIKFLRNALDLFTLFHPYLISKTPNFNPCYQRMGVLPQFLHLQKFKLSPRKIILINIFYLLHISQMTRNKLIIDC